MKHTDFWKAVAQIKAQMRREMAAALKAHGGEYVWFDPESDGEGGPDENGIPCVFVAPANADSVNLLVYRMYVAENGGVRLYGRVEDEKGDCFDEFRIEDVFADHVGFLIDLIPEIDSVTDVTEKQ